jgi:hypothetical protein
MSDILIRALQQAFLKPWYHLKKQLKDFMLPSFPDAIVD